MSTSTRRNTASGVVVPGVAQNVKMPPNIKITTTSKIRMAIITLLRDFAGGCCLRSGGGGSFFSGLIRKKPDGGGVSGGLISGRGSFSTGCGAMVRSSKDFVAKPFSSVGGLTMPSVRLGCRFDKSGGMVRTALSSFPGSAGISAPQCGQKRYFRVSTSGSCLLHLGQKIVMCFKLSGVPPQADSGVSHLAVVIFVQLV